MAETSPLRILLAEDNRLNQKVALRQLERLGYRADVASNGLEVVEALRRHWYDVVLMDVQMPEMDGIQAMQHIRTKLPAAHQPQVIAMTAHALEGDREWLLQSGMDGYISKPVRMQDLIAALQKVARRRGKHNTRPVPHDQLASTAVFHAREDIDECP
jgi:CheY-like chemotaxis protein